MILGSKYHSKLEIQTKKVRNISYLDFVLKIIAVDSDQTIMEEIISRFPHMGEDIFKELNSKDFCKSTEVSRSWNYFIRNQRVLKKAYKKRIQNRIHTLAFLAKPNSWSGQTPFHLAAERGYLPVCQQIIETADEKNPNDMYGNTPLHEAAENGHLSVCQLIVENVDEKNPENYMGSTPLDLAILYGQQEVKTFFESVITK